MKENNYSRVICRKPAAVLLVHQARDSIRQRQDTNLASGGTKTPTIWGLMFTDTAWRSGEYWWRLCYMYNWI